MPAGKPVIVEADGQLLGQFALAAALVGEAKKLDHDAAGLALGQTLDEEIESPPVGLPQEEPIAIDQIDQRHRLPSDDVPLGITAIPSQECDAASSRSGRRTLGRRARHRVYNEAEHHALVLLWEASDRICRKRLKALMPALIEAMEWQGHLDLATEIRDKLLAMSAATIDCELGRDREELGRKL